MPIATINGVSLYYEVRGRGDPVLLIMGLAAPSDAWLLQFDALSMGHRVCVFDNRGVARSSAPSPPYTMQQLADDALGLLDRLGWATAHVVGISMGGMIAQRLALTAPGRVRSLALLATHAGGWSSRPTRTAVRGVLRSRFLGGETVRMRNLIRMLHSSSYIEEVGMELIQQNLQLRMLKHTVPQHGLIGQLSAVLTHASLQELAGLRGTFPALVIVGDEDRMVRPENSLLIADALDAELLRFAGRGHAIHVEEPEAVTAALRRLFKGVA